jgi:hypothetical protein
MSIKMTKRIWRVTCNWNEWRLDVPAATVKGAVRKAQSLAKKKHYGIYSDERITSVILVAEIDD